VISKRSVGFLLILVMLISAGTLIQDYNFDFRIANERAIARAVDWDLGLVKPAQSRPVSRLRTG
jgi:hypothetical protein